MSVLWRAISDIEASREELRGENPDCLSAIPTLEHSPSCGESRGSFLVCQRAAAFLGISRFHVCESAGTECCRSQTARGGSQAGCGKIQRMFGFGTTICRDP